MSGPILCRICLNYGVKMYGYELYHLKQYYEEITAIKVKQKDSLPQQFCYECAAMLFKFHKFKEKCWMGQQLLSEMLCSGRITSKTLAKVDKIACNLKSPLDILTLSKNVKTYTMKNKSLKWNRTPKVQLDVNEEKYTVPDNLATDVKISAVCDDIKEASDDSLDINLAEYKHEILEKEKQIMGVIIDTKAETIGNILEKVETDVEINYEIDNLYENVTPDIYEDRMASGDEVFNDDEITNTNNYSSLLDTIAEDTVDRKQVFNNKKRKKSHNKIIKTSKKKKFEIGEEKGYLDPKHWLKVNLNEDEAVEEFKARAHNRKYLAAAFKCTDCYKGFSKDDMLARHVKLRHVEPVGSITCRFCNMRFRRKCFLTKHIAQHYTRFKCLRCDLVCDLKNTALFHNDYHNGVIRKCVHCGHEFKHLSTYYTHLRSHRSEHVCTRCGASFVSAVGLGIHTRNMHIDATPNTEEGEANTYCDKCDVKFVTRQAYEQHVYHSAKHGDSAATGDINAVTPAPYKLNSKFKLKGLRRNPRKQTPCNICNRNFSSYTAYMKHHNAQHKGEPTAGKEERHICEICGTSLAAGSVFAHLNTHTKDKMFACSTCGMTFNTKSSMTRHQLVHTGEKPYECSLCEKRFTQHSSMKLHYRTVHLKEPYPKRNRKKKIPPDDVLLGETYRHSEDSEENLKGDRWR